MTLMYSMFTGVPTLLLATPAILLEYLSNQSINTLLFLCHLIAGISLAGSIKEKLWSTGGQGQVVIRGVQSAKFFQ